jgi:hypothetical protein
MTAPTISATPKKPLISGRHPDMTALARTPVVPEAASEGELSARLRHSSRCTFADGAHGAADGRHRTAPDAGRRAASEGREALKKANRRDTWPYALDADGEGEVSSIGLPAPRRYRPIRWREFQSRGRPLGQFHPRPCQSKPARRERRTILIHSEDPPRLPRRS